MIPKIGLRAENLRVADPGQGRLICKVTECEFLGSETFIGLDLKGTRGLTVAMPGLKHIPQGEDLEIAFNDEDLHFFDAAGVRTTRPSQAQEA